MLSSIRCAGVLLILGISFAPGQYTYPRGNSPLVLDSLVAEVLRNNPQLSAARNQTAAARARIDQVTSWDAPQVGVEFFQTPVQSFPNPLKSQMEMDYFIQQMFPFP
ncbi:MAG: TolC family protein, partial [Bacteroidota bacterium]